LSEGGDEITITGNNFIADGGPLPSYFNLTSLDSTILLGTYNEFLVCLYVFIVQGEAQERR
jgi:hypothetical protein